MSKFILDWSLIVSHLVDLGVAYLLALPIAWDHEKHERTAGLRTFPLTAIAACGFALTGLSVFDDPEPQARVVQGLITGIGFVGGGAILKSSQKIKGTATAAGLWGTGAIGLAVAYGRVEIAAVISFVTFVTFFLLSDLKGEVGNGD